MSSAAALPFPTRALPGIPAHGLRGIAQQPHVSRGDGDRSQRRHARDSGSRTVTALPPRVARALFRFTPARIDKGFFPQPRVLHLPASQGGIPFGVPGSGPVLSQGAAATAAAPARLPPRRRLPPRKQRFSLPGFLPSLLPPARPGPAPQLLPPCRHRAAAAGSGPAPPRIAAGRSRICPSSPFSLSSPFFSLRFSFSFSSVSPLSHFSCPL